MFLYLLKALHCFDLLYLSDTFLSLWQPLASCEQRVQTYIYTPQMSHIMMLLVFSCLMNVFFFVRSFVFLFCFLDHFIAFRVRGRVMEPIPAANRRRWGTHLNESSAYRRALREQL